MKHTLAVVALDTDTGKTIVTAALGCLLKEAGVSTAVMKPIQTGSQNGRSDDLDFVMDMSGLELSDSQYELATPFVFPIPCSPHLAAKEAGIKISIEQIKKNHDTLQEVFDTIILETAGGILSPISETETNRDMLKTIGCPVVLVVPNKLGAISQTSAAIEVLKAKDIPIVGMILNEPNAITSDLEQTILENNSKTITQFTGVQVIGRLGDVSKRFHDKVLEYLSDTLPYLLGE